MKYKEFKNVNEAGTTPSQGIFTSALGGLAGALGSTASSVGQQRSDKSSFQDPAALDASAKKIYIDRFVRRGADALNTAIQQGLVDLTKSDKLSTSSSAVDPELQAIRDKQAAAREKAQSELDAQNETPPPSPDDVINPSSTNQPIPKDFVTVHLSKPGAKTQVRYIHNSKLQNWIKDGWKPGEPEKGQTTKAGNPIWDPATGEGSRYDEITGEPTTAWQAKLDKDKAEALRKSQERAKQNDQPSSSASSAGNTSTLAAMQQKNPKLAGMMAQAGLDNDLNDTTTEPPPVPADAKPAEKPRYKYDQSTEKWTQVKEDRLQEIYKRLTTQEKFKNALRKAGYDPDLAAKRIEALLKKHRDEREKREREEQKMGLEEGSPPFRQKGRNKARRNRPNLRGVPTSPQANKIPSGNKSKANLKAVPKTQDTSQSPPNLELVPNTGGMSSGRNAPDTLPGDADLAAIRKNAGLQPQQPPELKLEPTPAEEPTTAAAPTPAPEPTTAPTASSTSTAPKEPIQQLQMRFDQDRRTTDNRPRKPARSSASAEDQTVGMNRWFKDNFVKKFLTPDVVSKADPQINKILDTLPQIYNDKTKLNQALTSIAEIGWALSHKYD